MRKYIAWASAILAIVTAACGSTSPTANATPSPTCVNASAAHHAYVVVQHLSGSFIQKCVGFTGDTIDGKSLMNESGINYQTQTFSFGFGVCAVDNEPAQYNECFPKGKPYWDLFLEHSGSWSVAQTGFDQVQLQDKDALGWRYVQAADASPSPPPPAKET